MTDPVAIRYAPGTKERKTTMMWIWLLLLLMLILWACAWIFGLPRIAKSLTGDTQDALEKAGYENVDVDFDGREANLKGTVSADGKLIDAKVEDVEGVRWANSDLTTETPAAAPAVTTTTTTTVKQSDATFSAMSDADGKITLSGNVASNNLAAANVSEAADIVGAANVIDKQTVTEVKDASWMPGVPSALGSLKGVEEPEVEIANDRAVIRGTVGSEATKARIGDSWEKALTGATVDNQLVVEAAPAPAPVDNCTSDRLTAVADEGTEGGLFVTARAELTDEYKSSLDNVAAVLAECPDINVEIGGHTDSRGDDTYNLNLSQARADAVVAYLVSQDVEAGRLTGVGFGETQLQVENEQTAADLAQNRRIEFKPSN